MRPKFTKFVISASIFTCLSSHIIAQVTGELPLALPSQYITTDYNLDGQEDIVYTIGDTVYIATRIGYTTTPLHQFVLEVPDDVRAGDMDGDDFPELIFSNVNSVRYVKNQFGVPGEVILLDANQSFYEWTTVYDYDQDGDNDLLQNVYDLIIYLVENENGTFLIDDKEILTYTNKEAIQTDEFFCDINQDGFMDVLLYHPPQDMTLLWNYGDGRFDATPDFTIGRSAGMTHDDLAGIQFDMDDYNGDGFPDLYQLKRANLVTPYLYITFNRFGSLQDYDYGRYIVLPGQPIAIDAIDVNQDLQPDVILADSNSITAFYATQDTFDHVLIWTSQDPTFRMIERINVADLDEDGLLEIMVIDTAGQSRLLSTVWISSGPEYTCNRLPDPLDCPPGDIAFASQAEMDQFVLDYPNCKILNGKLSIANAVTDIEPLHHVIGVKGSVDIAGSQFDSLYQSNLRFVHGNLNITDNPTLTELYFNELRYVRDTLLIAGNDNLLVIDSFNKFEDAGHVRIEANTQLHTIRGFVHRMTTPMVALVNNPVLDTVLAFYTAPYIDNPYDLPEFLLAGSAPALFYIDGMLDTMFFKNAYALNLSLLKFNSFETLVLDNVSGITSIDGLSRQARYSLVAANCPNLVNLGGNVELIELELRNNPSLTSLAGFKPYTSLGKIALIGNPLLTNLSTLPNVRGFHGGIHLEGNAALNDISVLNVQFPSTLRTLSIHNNPALSVCHVGWVCDFLERDDDYSIYGNATGCHTAQAVNAACGFVPPINTDVEDETDGPIFGPNPANGKIITTTEDLPKAIRIFDGAGRLIEEVLNTREIALDRISNGLYTVVIEHAAGVTARKLMVGH